MGHIADNINKFKDEIPESVKLVAVSKTKPNDDILEAFGAEQIIFGENKVQDLAKKAEVLPQEIEWHFIGHLQSNKVKYIAPFVSLVHAVDSLKLLKEINKQAKKNDRTIYCLLQFHIASEETKFGLDLDEANEILQNPAFGGLKNIEIHGVMGMASYSDDVDQVRSEFASLRTIFNDLKTRFFNKQPYFKEISMGMSGDYPIAIEEGSTMIRVGSSIFGARNY
ncbi:MAG: YggS family pyridoxal phosphate-dependent enzyme [Bacteroidales bacterium]|nr:YggS family pyridoxal phosphate-dependent enzyme [Bacteroidales bacterium]